MDQLDAMNFAFDRIFGKHETPQPKPREPMFIAMNERDMRVAVAMLMLTNDKYKRCFWEDVGDPRDLRTQSLQDAILSGDDAEAGRLLRLICVESVARLADMERWS